MEAARLLPEQHRLERRAHARDRVERPVGRHLGRRPTRLQRAVAVDLQRAVGEHAELHHVARLERGRPRRRPLPLGVEGPAGLPERA